MVDFTAMVLSEEVPIYLQLIRHVKRGIAAGTIVTGDELPSRRTLSALLGINPNTIQKAFRFLEEEGIIESRAGAKSFVTADERKAEMIRQELIRGELRQTVQALITVHMSEEDASRLFHQIWKEVQDE